MAISFPRSLPLPVGLFLVTSLTAQQGGWSPMHQSAGPANYSYHGEYVAFVGDTDGDSVPDYLVGEPKDSSAGIAHGRVLLYSGADGSLLREHTDPVTPEIGNGLTGCGDLDGDGYADDAIAYSPYFLLGSLTYVAGKVVTISGLTGAELWSRSGPSGVISYYGRRMIGGEDMDGDGVPDLLVCDNIASSSFLDEGLIKSSLAWTAA